MSESGKTDNSKSKFIIQNLFKYLRYLNLQMPEPIL
jgi:hypothetical protein